MRNTSRLALLSAAVVSATAGVSNAEQFLTPQDFIIAIDAIPNAFVHDPPTNNIMYPAQELPAAALDGDVNTKYLNFGRRGAGFIAIPGTPTTIQSFRLFTANDAPERDPFTYSLWGTNAPVNSPDISDGLGEAWTLISNGSLTPPVPQGTPPTDRFLPYDFANVTNGTAYNAYKLYFPTVRDAGAANSMQISEVQFYDQPSGAGNALLNPGTDIRAIKNPQSDSAYTINERPQLAIDGIIATGSKYRNALNFTNGNTPGHQGAGLIITPRRGQSVLQGFQIATANDLPVRDPTSYEVYGTNSPITSADNSEGNAETWTLISSGSLTLPADRNTLAPEVTFANATPYLSYKVVFPTNGTSNNSMQIGEILFNGILFGEPTWSVSAGGGNWHVGANWVGSVPNGTGAVARFLTGSTAPQTVYSDVDVTVGRLVFNNPNTFVIAGAGNMFIDVASGQGSIVVQQGTHKINLPLFLNDNTTADVSAGATLVIADPLDLQGRTLTKTGPGTMNIISTVAGGAPGVIATNAGTTNADLDLGTSVTVNANGGNTNLNATQHLAGLSVGAGASAALTNGPSRRVLRTGNFSIAGGATPTGKFDLSDNGMILDHSGTSPLQTVRAQVASGYAGGAWNGNGINSSAANANQFAIGYAEASAIGSPGTFLGETIDGTTVLLRHTRYGDADLSGNVNLLDFNRLAANFGVIGTAVWSQGDFDYNGSVNLQDFNKLAANFGQVATGLTAPTPQDWANLASAVPEPASLGTLGLLALAARRRTGSRNRARE